MHQQLPQKLDVVGFVPEGVAEHLADAGELVLTPQGENHAEETVELSPLHALTEDEHVLGQLLDVLDPGHVEVPPQILGDARHELVLSDNTLNIDEHRLALMRIDSKRADHIEQRVGMDVLLVRVAAKNELQLGSRHHLPNDVKDIVTNDALGRGEIADSHPDNPPVGITELIGAPPLFDILVHRNIFRLPVVRLHIAIQIVGPLVFERQKVEGHRVDAIDHLLRSEDLLRLLLIKYEALPPHLDDLLALDAFAPLSHGHTGRTRQLHWLFLRHPLLLAFESHKLPLQFPGPSLKECAAGPGLGIREEHQRLSDSPAGKTIGNS